MSETSVTQELLHIGAVVIVAAIILLAGWNEPLRYLVMTQAEISKEEDAMFRGREIPRAPRTSALKGTALDRAPYRTGTGGSIEYTSNFDNRQMGTRTESDRREHSFGGRR
jgi:hypothetical protein